MNIFIQNKKIRIALSSLMIIVISSLVVCGVIYILKKNDQKKYSNLPTIQDKIYSATEQQKNFQASVQSDQVKAEGIFSNPDRFSGKVIYGAEINSSAWSRDVIKANEDIYIKDKDTWEKQSVSYIELNIITHPNWFQLQERLEDNTESNIKYLNYRVIFEKPNQEITKEIPQETLEQMRITGTLTVNKENFQIKKASLKMGEDDSKQYSIEFSPTSDAPSIKMPE